MVLGDEAEKLATEFVRSKKPGSEIEVREAQPTSNGWVLRGKAGHKTRLGYISEAWQITIKGEDIVAYKFGESTGFAIIGGPRR